MKESSSGLYRWRARPILAAILRVVIFLVPIAAALAVTVVLRPHLPPTRTLPQKIWWYGLLILLSMAVTVAVERVARRFLPLIMLLKLSMLFPDRAPSRFAVARQAGSVRRLRTQLDAVDTDEGGESLSAATILALATALQAHDRQTRGHSERVRVFTDLLGEELKLAKEDRYRLRWAALLHDIGKLTVSPRILNKPGKLNEHEWDVIRGHPLEGARIAAPLLEWLGPWGGAIAEHHERFDGAGYPARLAGADISLAGRIVAVADAYDTMTAVRSYKKPMAVRAARQELVRCAAGQFDPIVVRAFLSISVPLLLWKTGPLSLLVQLPFLARLQEIGQQTMAAAAQGVTAATVVAGVSAATLAGSASASPSPPAAHRPVPAVARILPGPSPSARASASANGQAKSGHGSREAGRGSESSHGKPSSSPGPSGTPDPSPSPSPKPKPKPPHPLPSLPPLPLPSRPPLPLPSLSPRPLPSLPPLPLPSLPPGLGSELKEDSQGS
jgi:HD-GYP domain-containing protein (c-di-GMP phosphodiesterase class II)